MAVPPTELGVPDGPAASTAVSTWEVEGVLKKEEKIYVDLYYGQGNLHLTSCLLRSLLYGALPFASLILLSLWLDTYGWFGLQ